MRLWLHLDLRRPQPFFTAALRNSRAPGLPYSRIPARTGLTFAMAGIEIGVCLLCNIFWNFIHDYALFFVKSGPASDS